MDFQNLTEQPSFYQSLEKMSMAELLKNINQQDQTVPLAVEAALGQIERLSAAVVVRMKSGGRLFYLGAGTSGRLGVVDASECPPTFGVDFGLVIGIIAGGDGAIRQAVEFAEDDPNQGWKDLQAYHITASDSVIGLAASGSTPYVLGALEASRAFGCLSGCIVCNPGSPIAAAVEFAVEVITGPEFVSGSTRMKAGTAQKLVLNMLSTSVMIQLGRVQGNLMVDMKPSNHKLIARGVLMLMDNLSISQEIAAQLLSKHGNVRQAMEAFGK